MRNKKNLFKTMLVLAMAMIMTLAMGITALAAGYTISVTPNNEASHTYEAYQIFKANVTNNAVLTEISWGDNIDVEALVTEVKKDGSILATDFASITNDSSAEAVVAILKTYENDSANLIAFAKAAGTALEGDAVASATVTNKAVAELSGLVGGYYLVKDKDNTQAEGAYTLNMLKVAGDVTMTAKADVPTIDKVIGESAEATAKESVASIGDTVPYVITTKVPDMTGYTKYFFVVNDTLSEGLTFNGDLKVKVGTADAVAVTAGGSDDNYSLTVEDGKITLVFKDFYGKYNDKKDTPITITYSATLNEKAKLDTTTGNPNTVKLTYSNNPNVTPAGDPDEPNKPGSDDVVGVTPDSKVTTYTTKVVLKKIDGSTKDALKGAKFTVTGNSLSASLVNEKIFVADADGTYYMLKDGTYTTTAATAATEDEYDSTTKMYKLVDNVTSATKTEEINRSVYVDSNGLITLTGLGAGTYVFDEDEAPEGYNKLTGPINITVTAKNLNSAEDFEWEVTGTEVTKGADGSFSFEVANNSGITLPTTGGIGTTIFYVVGGILVVGAAILLVTKKRMSVEEN